MHTNNQSVTDVLTFWFDEVTPKQKFTKDPAFDAVIKDRFEVSYWQIINGDTSDWRATPAGRLAEIIVLDQFARNMFRDQAQAFAGDALALELAEAALAAGADTAVSPEQQLFFYMPYMHSESPAVHERAVQIFSDYGNEMNLEFEMKHKAIIDEFGRYPHRNAALGRESTPEEIKWLEAGGGF